MKNQRKMWKIKRKLKNSREKWKIQQISEKFKRKVKNSRENDKFKRKVKNLIWNRRQIQFKFMFQPESEHNMSSFEADLKKQILGR